MKMKLIRLYETVYKPISVAFLLLYLICIAFSLIFFTADMTGFNLLYIYCRFAFFLSAISSVLAYLSGITSFRSHTDEVLSAQKYPGYYQNRTFLFILGYILFLIASILGILLIACLLYTSVIFGAPGWVRTSDLSLRSKNGACRTCYSV